MAEVLTQLPCFLVPVLFGSCDLFQPFLIKLWLLTSLSFCLSTNGYPQNLYTIIHYIVRFFAMFCQFLACDTSSIRYAQKDSIIRKASWSMGSAVSQKSNSDTSWSFKSYPSRISANLFSITSLALWTKERKVRPLPFMTRNLTASFKFSSNHLWYSNLSFTEVPLQYTIAGMCNQTKYMSLSKRCNTPIASIISKHMTRLHSTTTPFGLET